MMSNDYKKCNAIEITLNTEQEFEDWYEKFVVQEFEDGCTVDELVFIVVQENGDEAEQELGKQGVRMYIECYDGTWEKQIVAHARNVCADPVQCTIRSGCVYDFELCKCLGYI